MMDALKKELAEAFTDEDYVASITDVLCAQLIKSFKRQAKAEIEALIRKILKHKKKIVFGFAAAIIVGILRRK